MKKAKRKAAARPASPFLHQLASEKGKIRFLSYLRKSRPEIFQDHGIYQVDPLAVLEKNCRLQEELWRLPAYHSLNKDRGQLIALSIRQKAKTSVTSIQLSVKALKSYRLALLRRLQRIGKKALPHGHCPLLERILAVSKAKELAKKGHKVSNHPLWDELCDLVQVYILVQGPDGRIPDGVQEIQKSLRKLTEGQLDYLIDQVTLERKIARLNEILGKEKKGVIKKLIHQRMDKLLAHTVTKRKKLRLRVHLQECSPFLGIFRGCFGQDCSTQYSSGYALSPAERIFSIQTSLADSTSKGYVCGTLVTVQGIKGLYVHTIAGPRVSGAEAHLILQGLYQRRQELGVELVLLPSLGQLDNLINYLDIKSTYKHLVLTAKKKRIHYLDSLLRKRIGTYVPPEITYDEPGANRTGYLYHPTLRELDKVQTALTLLADDHQDPRNWNNLTLAEGQSLALDFLKMGLKEQSERVAKVLGKHLDGLMRLRPKGARS